MKQPNSFKSYLIALLLLSPFIAQANPVIPNPTAPNPIAPQPTAPKPTTPITTHPTTIPYSIAPLLPYIPQIGPDGRLVIPTAPLLPRYPTHYQDFFKKHKAYEYGAGLSLQEIGRIAQSKGYTLYSNRAFNEIASVLSPAPLWPEWAEKIREVQKKDVGSIDTAGQLTTYYVQSKGDYLGYAYFGVIDKNNREGKQQTAFDAILPEINKRNFFADTIDKQNLTPEQRDKAWRAWDKQQEAAAPRKPTDEQRETWRKTVEYSQREAAIRANRSQYEQAKEDFWKHLGQTLDDTIDHAQKVQKAFEDGAPADYSYASKSVYYANAMWDATTVAAGALTQGTGIDNAVATGYDHYMYDGGKQYINEKVQQYQQWAAEHPEANEYVKFAAYSGSAYAGYKGAAAFDAARAAKAAAKENAKAAAKAVSREVAAQSRIAQNQAARKAANNAINERAAANASKPTPYKTPAAPSANAPKPKPVPVSTPKPVANTPSSLKPVTPVPAPYIPTPMPYVPMAVVRSGADDFAGAVAARAAQQAAKKADDVAAAAQKANSNVGANALPPKKSTPTTPRKPDVSKAPDIEKTPDLGKPNMPKKNSPKGLVGKEFEEWLANHLGGRGEFQFQGRNFDGAIGNRWYEAKSGNYWNLLLSNEEKLKKFHADMGARRRIARDNGASYELHSNAPIPDNIKKWLDEKGIPYFEHLY